MSYRDKLAAMTAEELAQEGRRIRLRLTITWIVFAVSSGLLALASLMQLAHIH